MVDLAGKVGIDGARRGLTPAPQFEFMKYQIIPTTISDASTAKKIFTQL